MLSQFSSIFTQMVALFAAIGVGYICKKTGVMDADFDKRLSGLVLSATLPALILASVLNVDSLPDPVLMAQIIGLSVLSYVLFIPIAYIVTYVLRIPDGRRGVYRFMLIFGNTGFIGYPVLSAIFGPQTVVYAVVYNIVFNLLSFTFGAWLIASDNEYGVKVRMSWRDFVTPCNIATLITMALAFCGVHAVPVVGPALSTIGSFTTPATLLIVGSSLANLPAAKLMGTPRLWIACLVRMVATPLLIFAVMRPLAGGALLGVVVVLAAMPVATNGTMFCVPVRRRRQDHGAGHLHHYHLGVGHHPVAGNVRGCFVAGAGRWAHLPTLFLRISGIGPWLCYHDAHTRAAFVLHGARLVLDAPRGHARYRSRTGRNADV